MTHPQRALVTGASAGIGEAYVSALAEHCDEIVVVARRGDRLRRLEQQLGDRCRLIPVVADLASVEGMARVVENIRQGPPLAYLVNNAGFSTFGPYAQSDLDSELEMVHLHQDATLALTRAALPAMCEAGRGAVINVASVGAFIEAPQVAVYAATKAFLVSYSRSLRAELAGQGLRVQCLCPGYTRTEIHSRDSFEGFNVDIVPEELWMEAGDVVAESLASLEQDQWLVIPGEKNRVVVARALRGLMPDSAGSAE